MTLNIEIDHIHFYVEDAASQRDWFIQKLGYRRLFSIANSHTQIEAVQNGQTYFVLSSPLTCKSPVSDYLKSHPAGVSDIAFRVENLEELFARAIPVSHALEDATYSTGHLRWAKVKGWGSLNHTLIDRRSSAPFYETLLDRDTDPSQNRAIVRDISSLSEDRSMAATPVFAGIDHVVLNVAAGTLTQAVDWYTKLFGFQTHQTFDIQTQNSGLKSQVLTLMGGETYLNINEPTSTNSQIQEFLEANGGSGIQHIALRTPRIVQTVAQLRQMGQSFLSVPKTYYSQMKARLARCRMPLLQEEMQAIQAQQILADWQEGSAALLLQIFTRPIFKEPTFFLS
ncbi:4-hydroxyphenylpyruvate dioxygenase family protein [Altericista sp. CCNU0014]|uniref:4-hydroxyphenylpyruvate dioxygenase family protein n=1 Tax=Altericista sp. CCNU0014 TaxID=3082949 RepID=UPI00384E4B6E